LIIYIYGSDDFRKDIHKLLEHSNIRLRLDDNGEVIDLDTLDDLKNAIEEDPKNIYLIDDSKIIKKNSLLNEKFKFLKPKDGIEEDFLLDHGIGDISVNSFEELSKHIKNKLDSIIEKKESENVQDSIVEIVEDAYENEKDDNEYIQLDDELKELLSHKNEDKKEDEKEDQVEEIYDISSMLEDEKISDEKKNPLMEDPLSNDDEDSKKDENLQEELELIKALSFDEDFGNIKSSDKTVEQDKQEEYDLDNKGKDQGEKMSDDFSEFDSLDEAELLEALGISEGESKKAESLDTSSKKEVENSEKKQNLDLGSASANDIAKIISELLNNKSLEITIKVKD